jgi:hypothetical protein
MKGSTGIRGRFDETEIPLGRIHFVRLRRQNRNSQNCISTKRTTATDFTIRVHGEGLMRLQQIKSPYKQAIQVTESTKLRA